MIPVKANWGPSTEEQFFNIARTLTFRLNAQDDHVKHYRPMVLLLSGNPTDRRALLDMANHMTKRYGLLFLAHIALDPIPQKIMENITLKQKEWLRNENINAFYKLIESDSINGGTRSMIQVLIQSFCDFYFKFVCLKCSGVGKFKPNIVMMGYKANWQTCSPSQLNDYYQIIQ